MFSRPVSVPLRRARLAQGLLTNNYRVRAHTVYSRRLLLAYYMYSTAVRVTGCLQGNLLTLASLAPKRQVESLDLKSLPTGGGARACKARN